MTISPWTIYWITRLDSLTCFFAVSFTVSAIACVCLLLSAIGFPDKDPGWIEKRGKRFFIAGAVCLFTAIIGTLIPSTKEAAAMVVLPRIANNQKVQAIPFKVLDLANEWLDALKPKGDKK